MFLTIIRLIQIYINKGGDNGHPWRLMDVDTDSTEINLILILFLYVLIIVYSNLFGMFLSLSMSSDVDLSKIHWKILFITQK
jgi:hypothetical protein